MNSENRKGRQREMTNKEIMENIERAENEFSQYYDYEGFSIENTESF